MTTVSGTLRGFLLPFASHFRAQGWRVDGAARGVSECTECLEAFDQVWDIDWSRNPLNPQNLLVAPRRIHQIVVEEGYDLVHVHSPVAAFATRWALRGLRRTGKPRVVYTAHGFHFYEGGPALRNALFLSLEKLAGRWTDYLVVMNREDKRAAIRSRIVPPERLSYMPGIGLDTDYYSPGAVLESTVARVREELGLESTELLFVMIAEFIPRKRHQDVLKAFAYLGRPKIHLALAGYGPLMEPMQRLVADLGISDRVHFLGFRKDIRPLIRASVATLLPSEQEGLPRSVMESLSLAVPVIGADIRGVRDLLVEGSGLLVKLGDVNALARAMAWMLDHPEEARSMGRRGRVEMATYDVRRILALHETLYTRALGG